MSTKAMIELGWDEFIQLQSELLELEYEEEVGKKL
ncbi:hypothetical protein QR98_0002210 [Sarcoptes scabiei]|nr:hypothetical protein QR98_0002210 [Sarcoptes scabiei]